MDSNCRTWAIILSLLIIVFELVRITYVSEWIVVLSAVVLIVMALVNCNCCNVPVSASKTAPSKSGKNRTKKRR